MHAHSSQFMKLRTSLGRVFSCLSVKWESKIACSVSPHNAARFLSRQIALRHQRSSRDVETVTGTQVTRLKLSEPVQPELAYINFMKQLPS
jgi:hypothetical protein